MSSDTSTSHKWTGKYYQPDDHPPGETAPRWENWKQHVIVCGLGYLGLRVVEQLCRAGELVVVIDEDADPRLVRRAHDAGAAHYPANAKRSFTLFSAGIENATALICTTESELDNLEIALLARRLEPDLRVVLEMANTAVGRGVARVTGPGSVLDVASLAAPTLAESCLDLHTRPLEIAGEPFVLRAVHADREGTLRTLYGDLAPIAVVSGADGAIAVCPGRDHPVAVGDRVYLIGTTDDLEMRRIPADVPRPRVRRRGHSIVRFRRYVRGFVSESDKALRVTLWILLAVGVLSVVLLRAGYDLPHGGHMSVLDSAYFTTETLTTVGFGDFGFAAQHEWLRIWVILLMIIGATLVTLLYALLTNLLVSRRIAQSLGRQLATRMRDHVILVGLGSVGLRVLEQLLAVGQPVVVLERDVDNRYLARARALDVPVVFGDSTVADSLNAVNVRRARAVAVLTSSDLANIETGLAIDDLLGERRADVPVVLRIFDRDLAHTIEASFGFHSVHSTAELAAPWFVGAALGLDILTTFTVDQQPMLIGHLTVADTGGLRGRTMEQLSARIRVVAIRRRGADALEYPPRRDTRFDGGDQAYLAGPYEELLRVLRRDTAR